MLSSKRLAIVTLLLLALLSLTTPSDGANPCSSTLSDDLKIVIPFIDISQSFFALHIDYSNTGPNSGSEIWFKLTGFEVSTLNGCTNPATFISESGAFILRIPVLVANTFTVWFELEYFPTTDNNIWFKLKNYGLQPNLIFVTTEQGNGDLSTWVSAGGKTGLDAGDAICQASAKKAGLSGTFVALVSDETTDFYCRLFGFSGKKSNNCGQASLPVTAGPWVRTDGFPFGPTADKLFENGEVYVPVICDELGNRVPQYTTYWSGTQGDGALHWAGGETCSNWSNSNSVENGRVGYSDGTTSSWAGSGSSNCSNSKSLLCMQTGKGPALPDFASKGKTVFLTSVSGDGNLGNWAEAGGKTGLAAGDAICQSRAKEAKLKNALNYKAWLSNSSVNAIDRLTSNGPWVRLDGVKIADKKADLSDGELLTGISQDEFGIYYGNLGAWTGTDDAGIKTSDTCKGWMDGTSIENGVGGRSSWTREWSNDGFPSACDSTWLHLYCFED